MNFVEYTESIVNKTLRMIKTTDGRIPAILILGAGFKYNSNDKVTLPDPKKDIAEWITEFRDGSDFKLFDAVIMSRVLEHFPIRQIDWYLYQIYTIMKKDGILVCTVPDMKATAENLTNEFHPDKSVRSNLNLYNIQRLHFELFSDGPNVWDRHSIWTDINSIRYYLTMEKLFNVETINTTRVDSTIPPNELEVIARRV